MSLRCRCDVAGMSLGCHWDVAEKSLGILTAGRKQRLSQGVQCFTLGDSRPIANELSGAISLAMQYIEIRLIVFSPIPCTR